MASAFDQDLEQESIAGAVSQAWNPFQANMGRLMFSDLVNLWISEILSQN